MVNTIQLSPQINQGPIFFSNKKKTDQIIYNYSKNNVITPLPKAHGKVF